VADIPGVSRAQAMVVGTADITAARVMAEVDIALRATVDRMAATVAEAQVVVADTPAAAVVTPVGVAAATPEAVTTDRPERGVLANLSKRKRVDVNPVNDRGEKGVLNGTPFLCQGFAPDGFGFTKVLRTRGCLD
jgi:hypothetical protein